MARTPRDEGEQDILDIIPERPGRQSEAGGMDWLGMRARLALTILLGLTALGATVVTAWYIIAGGDAGDKPVPIITAEPGPVKVRPEDPGGMEIPHQDMSVYDRVAGEAAGGPERLRPLPEDPVAPPPPPVEPVPATPEVAQEALPALPETAGQAPPTPLAEQEEGGSVEGEAETGAVAALPRPAPKPTPPPQPAPEPAPKQAAAPPAGDFQVQLAAMRSEDGARQAWGRLQKAHPDVLGSLKAQIVRADLGAKGIYYRLRAGPLTEAAARKVCSALKQRNQGCLVARR